MSGSFPLQTLLAHSRSRHRPRPQPGLTDPAGSWPRTSKLRCLQARVSSPVNRKELSVQCLGGQLRGWGSRGRGLSQCNQRPHLKLTEKRAAHPALFLDSRDFWERNWPGLGWVVQWGHGQGRSAETKEIADKHQAHVPGGLEPLQRARGARSTGRLPYGASQPWQGVPLLATWA